MWLIGPCICLMFGTAPAGTCLPSPVLQEQAYFPRAVLDLELAAPGLGSEVFLWARYAPMEKELKLSDRQKTQIADLQDETKRNLERLMHAEVPERATHKQAILAGERAKKLIAEKIAEAEKKLLRDILTKEQGERLRQVLLQQRGVPALFEKDIADALALDDSQRKKLAEMWDKKEYKDVHSGRKAIPAEMFRLLTDEQRLKWRQMIGARFVPRE